MKFDQGQNCRTELLDICIDRGVVESVWPGAIDFMLDFTLENSESTHVQRTES